jgi:hypothetical protein
MSKAVIVRYQTAAETACPTGWRSPEPQDATIVGSYRF